MSRTPRGHEWIRGDQDETQMRQSGNVHVKKGYMKVTAVVSLPF